MTQTKFVWFVAAAACAAFFLDARGADAKRSRAKPEPPPAAEAPPGPPPPVEVLKAQREREALKRRCQDAVKKGEPPPEECKALELEVVFGGGVRPSQGDGVPRVVMQARDDEPGAAQEQGIVAEGDSVSSGAEGGDGSQSKGEKRAQARAEKWEAAREEPELFDNVGRRRFHIGLRAEYPVPVSKTESLRRAYDAVLHVAVEIAFQPLAHFQLALAADIEKFQGDSVATKEFSFDLDTPRYTDGSERADRDIGLVLDGRTGFGIRPTARLVGEWRKLQLSLGFGLGWHYIKTSGRWRSKVGPSDRHDGGGGAKSIMEEARWAGDDIALYSFELGDNGAYAVMDAALLYRFGREGRVGLGLTLQYTLPMHGEAVPEVTVEQEYGLAEYTSLEGAAEGYDAKVTDYELTPVRNLGTLSFFSFGLAADVRF